jgi:hypothetical protein
MLARVLPSQEHPGGGTAAPTRPSAQLQQAQARAMVHGVLKSLTSGVRFVTNAVRLTNAL